MKIILFFFNIILFFLSVFYFFAYNGQIKEKIKIQNENYKARVFISKFFYNFKISPSFIRQESLSIRDTNVMVNHIAGDESVSLIALDLLGIKSDGDKYPYSIIDKIDFQNKDTVVDIGADYGTFSLYIAKKNPLVHVVSCEPSNILYQFFFKSIQDNNIKNIDALNIGIGKKSEIITTNFDPLDTFRYFGKANENYDKTSIVQEKVKIEIFSDIIDKAKIKKIKLLKIDCKGCEFDLFENMLDDDFKNIEYLLLKVYFFNDNDRKKFEPIWEKINKNIAPEKRTILFY